LFVSESPRYLLSVHKAEEAAEVVMSIARGNGTLDRLLAAAAAAGGGQAGDSGHSMLGQREGGGGGNAKDGDVVGGGRSGGVDAEDGDGGDGAGGGGAKAPPLRLLSGSSAPAEGVGGGDRVAADHIHSLCPRSLWRAPLKRTMLPLMLVWFANSAGFYGQSVNLPSFLASRHLSEDDTYRGVLLTVWCGLAINTSTHAAAAVHSAGGGYLPAWAGRACRC
jgi:hypothetical protein